MENLALPFVGVCLDISSLVLFQVCERSKDLQTCTRLHSYILRRGLIFRFSDNLISAYVRCGGLEKAQELFHVHNSKDVSTWTSLITGCVQVGKSPEALSYFGRMQQAGLCPNSVTFSCALKACGITKVVQTGIEIHEEIARLGLLSTNIKLGNALISMYVKCGALSRAQCVAEELSVWDGISWNALIAGYVEHGRGEEALYCYEQMRQDGFIPDAFTFISLLKACTNMKAMSVGGQLHDEISKQGLLEDNVVLGSALVDMYAKCGAIISAEKVLKELPVRNVVTWNALISGYAECTSSDQAWNCFEDMQKDGVLPNAVTFTSMLKACRSMDALGKGEELHYKMTEHGLPGNDILLGNALVDMYARFGALTKAQQVFEELPRRNVTSWNILINGYIEHGEPDRALECFKQMKQNGLFPSAVTFACVLKACGTLKAIQIGEMIHDEISKQGLLKENVVVGTALIDMYAKCGSLTKATQVLEGLSIRDCVTWTVLVARYAEQGEEVHALDSFEHMLSEGVVPNAVTLGSLLKACASAGAIGKGEEIHEKIVKQGLLENNVALGNALIDMYAKCGFLTRAQRLLMELPMRNVISWTSLMGGLMRQCEGSQIWNCFEQLQHEGLFPDAALFSCMLSACSRLRLVEAAEAHFVDMHMNYGIKPDLMHYTCLVDAFGRVGHLERAALIMAKLPTSDVGAWSSFLGSCRNWGNLNIARWAFEYSIFK
ncbi:hypothetical protein KP509_03G011400 [Ceratopteris richardii]|uniref:Pentatricopeptide repeat-containing protein n=1 Tax=Ceratopteris richardii TaxID=49495 RepID=A0A8T2V3X9_CERRI|nr:hypothetical protein KP509_03G011400 [Ceratopteris richardii]